VSGSEDNSKALETFADNFVKNVQSLVDCFETEETTASEALCKAWCLGFEEGVQIGIKQTQKLFDKTHNPEVKT
jgi:hypothetical protein